MLDERRADKYRRERLFAQRRYRQLGLKAVDLPPEGVTPDADIHQPSDATPLPEIFLAMSIMPAQVPKSGMPSRG